MWKLSCEMLPDIVTFAKGPSSKEPDGSLFDALYEKYDAGPNESDLEEAILMEFDVDIELSNIINGVKVESILIVNANITSIRQALLHIKRAFKLLEILNNEEK